MYLVHSFVLDLSPLNHLWRDTSITALPEVLFIPIIFFTAEAIGIFPLQLYVL